MKTKNLFTIKLVAERTGLKPHVIRAWESRYRAVVPNRTPTNRRLYCQDDIGRLKLLKMAIDAGHQISCIAKASEKELHQIIDLTENADRRSPPPSALKSGSPPPKKNYQKTCLQAVVALDPEKLDRVLSEAAVNLSRRRWVEEVVVPLFNRIGELWLSGRLKILNEHIASNCTRTIMWDMLRSVEIASNAPRIVIGTPIGQWHELGALSAALASAEAGWRPIYVGVNLPAEELASAVKEFDAKCIGLSISHPLDDRRLQPELINLRRYIGPHRHILIGGLKGPRGEQLMTLVKARRMGSWEDLLQTLRLSTLE